MTTKELRKYLLTFPDDMPVKLMINNEPKSKPIDLTFDNIVHTSESVFIDSSVSQDKWDHEDGKIRLGDGQQYLLFNPLIY